MEETNSEWVRFEDYASLKAEVERLTKDLADEKSANANVEGRQNSANRGLSMEIARLKAEVSRLKMEESKLLTLCETYEADLERLRKAGDAMAHWVGEDTHFWWGQPEAAVEAWNAAKEGKQP